VEDIDGLAGHARAVVAGGQYGTAATWMVKFAYGTNGGGAILTERSGLHAALLLLGTRRGCGRCLLRWLGHRLRSAAAGPWSPLGLQITGPVDGAAARCWEPGFYAATPRSSWSGRIPSRERGI
jgi:hypothetical protein